MNGKLNWKEMAVIFDAVEIPPHPQSSVILQIPYVLTRPITMSTKSLKARIDRAVCGCLIELGLALGDDPHPGALCDHISFFNDNWLESDAYPLILYFKIYGLTTDQLEAYRYWNKQRKTNIKI